MPKVVEICVQYGVLRFKVLKETYWKTWDICIWITFHRIKEQVVYFMNHGRFSLQWFYLFRNYRICMPSLKALNSFYRNVYVYMYIHGIHGLPKFIQRPEEVQQFQVKDPHQLRKEGGS